MKKTSRVSGFGELMKAAGAATVTAGHFIVRQIAAGCRKIDPDVPRHFLQMPLLTYTLFSSRHQRIEAGEADGYPPLVFVHGLGGGRGDFLLMAHYFRLKGRKRSYRIKFPKDQSIEEMATSLAEFIRQVTKATRQKKVDLVAHSLGGLVARAAVIEHRLETAVKTLITLGSPHQGTHPARYLYSKIIKDLRPESLYLKKLNKKRWPKRVRGVALWSRNDLFILPPESATADGMEAVEMTPFTHYSYLIDPLCWSYVDRILTESPRS